MQNAEKKCRTALHSSFSIKIMTKNWDALLVFGEVEVLHVGRVAQSV